MNQIACTGKTLILIKINLFYPYVNIRLWILRHQLLILYRDINIFQLDSCFVEFVGKL